MSYPHVPFPVSISLSSPVFDVTPVTSNSSAGWTPSCTTSDCASTASWSTGAANSTLAFTFWGWDVAFDGRVQGNLGVKVVLDGKEMDFNPSSNDTLFNFQALDNLKEHNLQLSVQNAAAGSLLTINQARINASTFSDQILPSSQWDLPSNDGGFTWTGFQQQPSTSGSLSPTTYVSSTIGDKASFQFNGSTVLIYGPCGPSNGLVYVSIDGESNTVNTSTPIAADNCLLYQSRGYSALNLHQLEVMNQDGKSLGINHMQFFRVLEHTTGNSSTTPGAIVGGVIGGIVFVALCIVLYSLRSRKTRQKINKSFTVLCS
ncbi:hypothetical protein BDV93DRAFT_611414 [Ceratobasidium sp. AG-I]|nr:hypothetical protein BDV93DRAFT_611414 [Ceratobasidium sp. AG-I]